MLDLAGLYQNLKDLKDWDPRFNRPVMGTLGALRQGAQRHFPKSLRCVKVVLCLCGSGGAEPGTIGKHHF